MTRAASLRLYPINALFGGNMRRAVLVVGLVLGGCAGGGDWVKEGATDDELRQDLAICRDQGSLVTSRDRRIEQDIRASRVGSPLSTDLGTFRDDVRESRVEQRFDDVVDRCMRGRGYARAGEDL